MTSSIRHPGILLLDVMIVLSGGVCVSAVGPPSSVQSRTTDWTDEK